MVHRGVVRRGVVRRGVVYRGVVYRGVVLVGERPARFNVQANGRRLAVNEKKRRRWGGRIADDDEVAVARPFGKGVPLMRAFS